jgi:hypothetical protein
MLRTLFVLLVALISFSVSLAQGDRLKAGVVTVSGNSGQRGSGFIVKLDLTKAEVYIITAAHVVGDEKHPHIEFFTRRNRSVNGTVIQNDDDLDLAIILVDGRENIPDGLTALTLDSSSPSGGDDIFVIGSPRLGAPWSVMKGNVSAVSGKDVLFFGDIGEGTSGACLVKGDGVIGMVERGGSRMNGEPARAVRAGFISELLKTSLTSQTRQSAVLPSRTTLPQENIVGNGGVLSNQSIALTENIKKLLANVQDHPEKAK